MNDVAQTLREAAARLQTVSDTARLDAELLMAHVLGTTRSQMLLQVRDLREPAAFADYVARRMTGEPVAYIIGTQEFYGRGFRVTPDVLIPRADSETLIEAALPLCGEDARILDLGTGTGALLLTLLAEKPQARGIGIDASGKALNIARSNAQELGLADRAQMLARDWTQNSWADDLGQFGLIVANPPYVESNADLDPGVRDHEPAAALFAGADGLDDYRILMPRLRNLTDNGGAVVLEIGHEQDAAVGALAEKEGFATVLHRDLAGRPRALVLR